MEAVLLHSPWLKVRNNLTWTNPVAGAEFTEYILQAAFGNNKNGNNKNKTVQAYIDLTAESGGEAIKKEIGGDLAYFSVNVQLGVSVLDRIQRQLGTVG